MRRALATALGWAVLLACSPAELPPGAAPLPACPREAAPDANGRCVCAPPLATVLGACVQSDVARAYCGPAASPTPEGTCAFRSCRSDEALETGGACRSLTEIIQTGPRCRPSATVVVEPGGRTACVPPDSACPRGTFATGATCAAPPACPPGTLAASGTCRPVVTRGSGGTPTVDLGAWGLFALGASGGPASPELCRPLSGAPGAFGLVPGESVVATLVVSLRIPDQDLSRLYGSARLTTPEGHPPTSAARDAARTALAGLLEPLRSLGGQASAAGLDVEVRCTIASF